MIPPRRSAPQRQKIMAQKSSVERIQTGMRLEKRMVKVLKALAEYLNMTLGDLITQLERVSEGKIEPLTEDIDRDLRNSLAHGLFRLKGIFLICYRDLTLNERREIIVRDLWIKARTHSLIAQCLIRLIAEWYITT